MNAEAILNATETADNAAPKNPDALRQHVIDCAQRASDLRSKLAGLVTERTKLRGQLAEAIGAWSGLDRVTPEANARAYIKHEIAERARLAVHGPDAATQPTPGRSAVDRAAVYSSGGDADTFAKKQHRTGFRRGSFPGAMKGARIPPRG